MTERQIIAILAVLGATAAIGFAIYNVYLAFKPIEGTKVWAKA